MWKRITILVLISLLLLLGVLALILRLRYGGGCDYPDLSREPLYPSDSLHLYFSYPEPIGNVAASRDTNPSGRVFFTVHPESRPRGHKLLEIVGDTALPYPDLQSQEDLFQTVLGLYVDRQQRLWTIDHGNHGFGEVRLLAFDLKADTICHDFEFPTSIAERGSFFNDLCASPDGRFIFIADVGFFSKRPSLVVYDTKKREARSLLERHPAVASEGYIPVTPIRKMTFFGRMVALKAGIDGIDIDAEGRYVYFAAMTNSGLFRIPVRVLTDPGATPEKVAAAVERICTKPMSDGIRTGPDNLIYITDIEHSGISIVNAEGTLRTLIRDDRIRWSDGLSLGGNGAFYLADSAIPDQMMRSRHHIEKVRPYYIWRFQPYINDHD